MKANELMIGNWVNCKGMEVELEASDFAEDYATGGNFFAFLEPILITEDHLDKYGFYHINGEEYRIDLEDDNIFKIDLFDGWFSVFIDWVEDEKDCWKKIAYVYEIHQLQNLIFALTGKELTVN